MITERQKAFRQEYRSRIVGWYDGYVHILIIYAMGAAAFYVYVAHIHNVTWLEWLTLPLTFVFTNIFEWAVHRFIMHRPVNIKGLRAIYERHTLNHHQFFTDEEMRFRDPQGLARHGFPALCAGCFHPDVDSAGCGAGSSREPKCRMAVHVRDHGHVSHLRVHAFLLSCR